MNVERKTLVLQNRRISIQMELLADQLVAQKGLTAAQANMLFLFWAIPEREPL